MQSNGIYNTIIMANKIHYTEIDIYKGLAILLIILGHSFCSFPVDFNQTEWIKVKSLFSWYSLNMFFLASGVLFSVKEDWCTFLRKKSLRLMLPWLAFTIFSLLIKKLFSAYTHSQTGSFVHEIMLDLIYGKSYWFLYVLFIMMIITRTLKNKRILVVLGGAFLLLLLVGQQIPVAYNFICAERLIHYYPWFLMGYLLKDDYSAISKTVMANVQKSFIIGLFLLVTIITIVLTGLYRYYLLKYYLMPALGCISFYMFSCTACKRHKAERFFSFFGKYSLQYYLNHVLIMLGCYYLGSFFFVYSPLAALLVIFFSAIIISSIMLWLEQKMPKPIRLLFGFL